jgi:hypothetical protein
MLVALACGRSTGQPEPDIVVPVVPLIPVALSDPTVVIVVVPRTTPQNSGKDNIQCKDMIFFENSLFQKKSSASPRKNKKALRASAKG